MNGPKRKLKNLLLDRLQFRYTAVLVVCAAALLVALGTLVYRYSLEATESARLTVVATIDDAQTQSAILGSLEQADTNRLWLLVGGAVLLLVLLAIFGIVVTHKVAGPLHRMSSLIDHVRAGRLAAPAGSLRKGDELHRFFALFAAMLESLRMQAQAEHDKLGAAIAELEKLSLPADAQATLERLRALKRDKEKSLADTKAGAPQSPSTMSNG